MRGWVEDMPRIAPARKAAFRILLAVEGGRDHADELLRTKEVDALAPADRNLATALVLGVLRWQIWLDEQVRARLKRPNARLDPEVRIALRLGLFQLRFLDRIPAHAAIDESVELSKQSGHRFAAGMVNAVLRGSAAQGELREQEIEGSAAHPAWMVERWAAVYGTEAMQAICRHGQSQPRTTVRVADAAVAEELRGAGIALASSELVAAAQTVTSGDVTAGQAFRAGRVRVQDEGSQLIAELAARANGTAGEEPKKILDACAAPGGKTLILAERNPEARIVACESSPKRLAELRARVAAYADRVECRLADAALLEESAAFDLALADVPCSGTGTLGRNPEIRHRLRWDDPARLAGLQQAILQAALRAVRPGGRVIYSTCSLEPEENEQVVAAVLARDANLRQIALAPLIDTLGRDGILQAGGAERVRQGLTPEGALRLLPGIMPTDGFFVALMERRA